MMPSWLPSEKSMARITFRTESTCVRVFRDRLPFGRISLSEGLYKFYREVGRTSGGYELQDDILDRLKSTVENRYRKA